MKKPDQKGIIHIFPLLIVLVIAGVAIWFFLNRGESVPNGTEVSIPPSQLMPFVSAQEARITICNLKKEGLFSQTCQSKFDVVGKEDGEKITELFVLLDKIQNDKSIPDYERLLLAQAVFAALPIGDNPESGLFRQSLFSRLKDYLTSQITVYAQEKGMSEEEFKDLMKKDLQKMVDSLPKEDNSWVINIMVSKYSWKDGKPQPLYSHQYMESFDPFPNNPNVNTKDINYHVQSAVGSKASGQTVDSEMIGYSFTIQSWKSQEYTSKEGPIEEKFLVRKRNRSDSSYLGEPYLNNLLDAVKMPSTKRSIESSDIKTPDIEQKSTQDTSQSDQAAADDIIYICETPERFCEAVEQCAKIDVSEGDRQLTYEERYADCKEGNERYFNDTCRLMAWMKESYNCPLGDNSCEARGKQAAAALKIPECKPTIK